MSAKQNILAKLRKSLTGTTPVADNFDVDLVTQPYTYAHGQRITQHWANNPDLPKLKAYDRPVEEWKAELFNDTPASLTTTLGAIAATGSLILWPTREEPRLMSLAPPVHFALLKASEIRD